MQYCIFYRKAWHAIEPTRALTIYRLYNIHVVTLYHCIYQCGNLSNIVTSLSLIAGQLTARDLLVTRGKVMAGQTTMI